MRGLILAGGTGSRLYPCSKVTNKHLLSVWSKPMIYYPLETLINAGIDDIMVVTGREHMGDMLELLGSGKEFGVGFTFRVQDESGGIAEALLLAEDFVGGEDVAVILGDNLFADDFRDDVRDFLYGAKVFLKEVPDPERFGVASVDGEKISKIVEKPEKPESNLAVTGFYLYDANVFDIIRKQQYSARRELEITDTNQAYIDAGKMFYRKLDGFWSDMGTFSSLLRSANFLARSEVK